MAKATRKTKVKKATQKRRKSQMFGVVTFPDVKRDNPKFRRLYYDAQQWLRGSVKAKELKKETLKWAKTQPKLKKMKFTQAEDFRFLVIGRLCYLLNREADVMEGGEEFISEKLTSLQDPPKTKKKETKTKPKKTIQEIVLEKSQVIASEFEEHIDDFIKNPRKFKPADYDPLSYLRGQETNVIAARHIKSFFQPNLDEIDDVLDNPKQYKEEYGHLTSTQLKKLKAYYESIVSACDMIQKTKKLTRKAKAPKAVDKAKLVEKVAFQKEETSLGLVSVAPVSILGSRVLWIYNTKTKTLGKLTAADAKGFEVSGTTIKNLKDGSVGKTVRKPIETMKEFRGTQKALQNKFKALTTKEKKITGRLNKHTILLKVY